MAGLNSSSTNRMDQSTIKTEAPRFRMARLRTGRAGFEGNNHRPPDLEEPGLGVCRDLGSTRKARPEMDLSAPRHPTGQTGIATRQLTGIAPGPPGASASTVSSGCSRRVGSPGVGPARSPDQTRRIEGSRGGASLGRTDGSAPLAVIGGGETKGPRSSSRPGTGNALVRQASRLRGSLGRHGRSTLGGCLTRGLRGAVRGRRGLARGLRGAGRGAGATLLGACGAATGPARPCSGPGERASTCLGPAGPGATLLGATA